MAPNHSGCNCKKDSDCNAVAACDRGSDPEAACSLVPPSNQTVSVCTPKLQRDMSVDPAAPPPPSTLEVTPTTRVHRQLLNRSVDGTQQFSGGTSLPPLTSETTAAQEPALTTPQPQREQPLRQQQQQQLPERDPQPQQEDVEAQPRPHQGSSQQAQTLLLYDLDPEPRLQVVGWMAEVAEALGLQTATLSEAEALFNCFLEQSEIYPPRGLLQLLALACMSTAVRRNEEDSLSPALWLSLAVDDNGRNLYEAWDLERMESLLLGNLSEMQWHELNQSK